jgi:enoyl-CoA hydratase/carnithine racemase
MSTFDTSRSPNGRVPGAWSRSWTQFEVSTGVVPGGGPMARLSRLAGRGRAIEILVVADDLDGPRAEQHGYVNRVIADDQVTLPADSEFPPALADFFSMFGRPRQQEQFARLVALGLNTDGDLERSLGRRAVESIPDT